MIGFSIKQIIVAVGEDEQLCLVSLNDEQRVMLEMLLPAVFDDKIVKVIALPDDVQMVPLTEAAQ